MICYHCQEQFKMPQEGKVVLSGIGRTYYCNNCIVDLRK